ncbi:hypothetical protein O0I10_010252 [Lichtheimia ornata]|uniref:Uncharacterized protein n=1 Tax=Lichtheimia ornata TaxID=688661 RepID=A0AAD7UXP9_9FUNG|nr:uncharacterized protein O0I10_010252 [Lichtheimia ornata]KAJ8654041.1 hypothetical protein O0I10_010252 [Lichtheimia ornata]
MDSTLFNSTANDNEQVICVNPPLPDYHSAWPLQQDASTSFPNTDPDNSAVVVDDHRTLFSDEDDDEIFMVSAPPPSPQEPSMLDAVFAEQLNRSLQVVANRQSPEPKNDNHDSNDSNGTQSSLSWNHAQTLDKLLRKAQGERPGCIRKRRKHKTKFKTPRALCNKSASELADAIAMIRISSNNARRWSTSQQQQSTLDTGKS